MRMSYLAGDTPDNTKYHYIQFNWIVRGTMTAGATPEDFGAWYFANVLPVFVALIPRFTSGMGAAFSFHDGTHYRQIYQSAYAQAEQGIYLPMPNGVCIELLTPQWTRSGTGRLHWPWVRKVDVIGSYVQFSVLAWLNPLLHMLTHSLSPLGMDWQPSVWSRKLDVNYPIEAALPGTKTTWLQKRRWKDGTKIHYPLFWPTIW